MSNDQSTEIPVAETTPTKRTRRRGCLVWFLIFAAVYYWVGCHSTPLRVSKETTYALGPMTSDGKRIDYFRAIEERYYPPEMQTDDNGYRLIVKACGVTIRPERTRYDAKTGEPYAEKIDPEPFRLQVYEKLGLDPNEKPTLKIESPYGADYLAKYDKENPPTEEKQKQRDKFSLRQTTIWTLDEYPMLKDWLDENTVGIDLLGEAVRKSAFRIPYTRENEYTPIIDMIWNGAVFETTQSTREWARAAAARAQYRIGIGDIDGAIDDIVTIHILARHTGRQGFLVSGLVGIAIEGVARSIGIGGNPEFPPTKEQIERFVTEINALPLRPTLSEVLESERYFVLAGLQDRYWGKESYPSPTAMGIPLRWAIDINVYLTRANKIYDVITGKSTTVDGKELEDILQPSWNPLPLLFVRSRSNRFIDTEASLFIPAMQAAREAWRRCECTENMQRLTLALLLYEKDHGRLPEGDWREAVKPYLGDNADRYFQCPTHGLAQGETTYAMIGNVPNAAPSPNQILLVEVFQSQKLGEGDGRLPFDKAKFWRQSDGHRPDDFDGLGSYHPGGISAGFRSGAVRFIAESTNPDELQKLLDGTAEKLP